MIILGALSAFGPLSMDMYLPSLPSLTADLHASTSMGQLSITSCLIGLALGQIFAGPYSDSIGRRRPLLIGLLIFAAASFLCAVSMTIHVLLILRFFQGFAGAAGIVISNAIARDLYSGVRLTKFISMLAAVNGIFPIISPVFGGFLLKFTSWHGVFIVLGVIGLLLFLAAFFGVHETLPESQRENRGIGGTFSNFGGLFRDRLFMGYALSLGLIIAAMFCYISGSSFVLQNMFGLSSQEFSFVFATNGLGIIIASQLTGILAGKFGEKKLLVSGLIIAACASIVLFGSLFIHPSRLIMVLIPLFFVVSMVGVVNTTAFSLAMQNQGQAAGSAAAILGLGMNLIGGVFAPLVGIGGSRTYFPMSLLILICDVGALLSYLLILKRKT